MESAGYEEVAGSFWGGFCEHRGLDFDKSFFIKEVSCRDHCFMACDKIFLHFVSSEVEVAVFKAGFLCHVGVAFQIQGKGFRGVEKGDFGCV